MGISVFVSLFLIYLFSLAPSIYPGDSSLFAAASFSLGSAHHPGYPLYIMLGKLFTFLPFGNVAYKINILNAVLGALACCMVYRVSLELTKNKAASWAGAMLCGLVPLFFIESIKTEVYTLNAFLSTVIFYLGLKAVRGEDFTRNTLAAIFLVGLGMGNHQTIGIMGVALVIPVALRRRDITAKWIMLAPLIFLAGFSINLLLYLRSQVYLHRGSLIVYSFVGSWESFLYVFLRKGYGASNTLAALKGSAAFGGEWFTGLKNGAVHIIAPSIKYLFPFTLLGLAFLWKQKKILTYLLFTLIVWIVVLSKLTMPSPEIEVDAIEIVSPYFLPVLPILFMLTAAGFAHLSGYLNKERMELLPKALPYVLAALPFVFLPFTVKKSSLSDNFIAHDYGRDLLTTLPPKSLLLNYADNPIFSVFYMRSVERLREDVIAMNTAGNKDNFGLESSPGWKYDRLYPDFFKSVNSSIKEINRDFGYKGKLFANSPTRLTDVVGKHYSFYPYHLTVALLPKNNDERSKAIKEKIKELYTANFDKINYERAIDSPYMSDLLSRELFAFYSLDAMVYGGLLKQAGDMKAGGDFYKKAFLISNPKMFIWPYINFLLREGMEEEAFYLIEEIKAIEGYEQFAKTLEGKAVSVLDASGEKL